MKFITRIPTHDNSGNLFPPEVMQEVLQLLVVSFGGYTSDSVSEGGWVDNDGTAFIEPARTVSVTCDRRDYVLARDTVIQIGRLLDQKAMYFEVQYFDGVEIIHIH